MPRTMTSLAITKKITYDVTKIYFGDILHLALVRRNIVGLQSWKSVGVYSIEITFSRGATILVEYDSVEKWERIINLITEDLTL